jgi:hypothetical protein
MKKMANENESSMAGLKKVPEIIVMAVSQKQTVMDLETGDEKAEITVAQKRFFAPEYSEKEYGGTEELFEAALFNAATELVSPRSKQIDALLYRATQESYQAGKAVALSAGNYLTKDLAKRIVNIMQGNVAFVDVSASDCLKRWKEGYKAQKPGAIKMLETAKAIGDEVDF